MYASFDDAFHGDHPLRSATLCRSLAHEIRRVALAETDHGDGMIWLLARLTADRPEVTLSGMILRLGVALMASNGPLVWQYARSDGTESEAASHRHDDAQDPKRGSPPERLG